MSLLNVLAAGAHDMQGIVAYSDAYQLAVESDGQVFPIAMRLSTIVEPAERSVAPGSLVRIHGSWLQGRFSATHIHVLTA